MNGSIYYIPPKAFVGAFLQDYSQAYPQKLWIINLGEFVILNGCNEVACQENQINKVVEKGGMVRAKNKLSTRKLRYSSIG